MSRIRLQQIMTVAMMIVLGGVNAIAQDITFNATAPSMVEVGERFRVQYSVSSQNVSNFNYPQFTGFDVIYGPSTSSQSSIYVVQGKRTQTSSYTYTFTLMAQKVGTFNIPAASIQVDGKTYESQSLKIQVVESNNRQQNNQQGGSQQRQRGQVSPPTGSSISASDLFMTATASRTRVYEQEAILVTYKLYTLVNLTQLDGKLPTLDGFQIQEIPLPNNKEFTTESYNGRMYHTVVWSQYVLFPQKSGDLVIPSVTYEAVVVQQNRAMDPIEAFFNGTGGLVEVKKKITTPQLTIHVSPLPQKPSNFSGAVGTFTLSSSVSTDKLKANDALTMKISLKGAGNMKLISAPDVDFPKDFETYDAKANDNFSLTRTGLSGTKEFEYLAVPRHAGTYTIPSVDFVYFDTSSQTYKTLSTESYTIEVEKGSGTSGSSVSDYTNVQQDVKQLNHDIRYIKTNDVQPRDPDDHFFGSWRYWLSYLIPLLLFTIILVVGRKRIKDNANVAKTRGRKANKVAGKRLKTAARFLEQKNQNEFYDEVMRALWGYIADKLNISQAHLNKDNITSALTAKQVNPSLIDQFLQTLNQCEYARYAPGNPNENMETVYNSAVNVISEMESNIKKSSTKNTAPTMTLLILMLFMASASVLNAQTKTEADELYSQEKYEDAARMYEEIIQSQGIAPELYYNLANSYYKLGDIPHAILNYERALLLDPSDTDTKANLALARGKTTDKVTPASEMFFITWWRNLTNMMTINSWLIIAFIMFVLMFIGILVFVFMSSVTSRKVGLYGAMVCLILTIVANLCALSQYLMQQRHDSAIVMNPAVTVKSSPSDTSTDLFVIHEGSKVEILDRTMADWREIKLEEGKMGWVPKETIEEI